MSQFPYYRNERYRLRSSENQILSEILRPSIAYDLTRALVHIPMEPWLKATDIRIICDCAKLLGDMFMHIVPDTSPEIRGMIAAHLLFRGCRIFFKAVSGSATPEYLMQFAYDPLTTICEQYPHFELNDYDWSCP